MSSSIGWWVGIGLAVLGACGGDPNQGPEASEPPLLTRRDGEPPGAKCEFGGTAVHAGLDRNRNGSLDDAEVTHTEYLCNPANRVVVRKDPLGPTRACPGGGVAVLTGIDDNGDGVLQDAEIDQTTPLCNSLELWDGDFTADNWSDPLKVAALQGARVVAGSLTVAAAGATALPLLERVTGDLVIGAGAVSIELPALHSIGGDLTAVVDGPLETLALPALTTLGGDLALGGLGTLTAFAAPSLTEIAGDIDISNTTALVSVDLGALTSSGGIRIFNAFKLTTLLTPSLREIHPAIQNGDRIGIQLLNTGLQAIDFTALQSMTDKFSVLDAPALRSVNLPELTATTNLSLISCPLLETVAAPKLASVNTIKLLTTAVHTLDLGGLTIVPLLSINGAALSDLSGLHALTTAGLVILEDVGPLHDLHGLTALAHVSTLELEDNAELTSLDGLEALTEFPGDLALIDNPALTSLAGLRNVGHVGGSVQFIRDAALTDLPMPALTAIEGVLEITDLDALTTLAGLDPLTSVGAGLDITGNDNLPADLLAAFKARLGH